MVTMALPASACLHTQGSLLLTCWAGVQWGQVFPGKGEAGNRSWRWEAVETLDSAVPVALLSEEA